MKALSVSSGYAALIGEGEKTIECRTWQTDHRGELLVCSNQDRMPGTIPGHALHIVHVTDVRPFTRKDLDAACMDEFSKGCFAWVLTYVCPVVPFKVRGKPGLFDVDDALIHRVDESAMSDREIDDFITHYINPLLTA